MRIFAPNTTVAKSRFWYFLQKLRKVKKANGEIVSLNAVSHIEKSPTKSRVTLMRVRFMRNDHRRSRTLVSGFVTIPVPARTTCTRSTERCREQTLLRPCTRTWLRVTVHASGPSMYASPGRLGSWTLMVSIDPQSCGAREDRRCQATLPQTAASKESEVPSTTPNSTFERQEALLSP